jgi:hypothetical protein
MWCSVFHIHVVGGSCRPSVPSQRFSEMPLDGSAEPLQDVRRAKDERARIVVPDAVHLQECTEETHRLESPCHLLTTGVGAGECALSFGDDGLGQITLACAV